MPAAPTLTSGVPKRHKFELTVKTCIRERCPSCAGRTPERELTPKLRPLSAVRSPISEGREPEMEFCPTFREVSDVMSPSCVGKNEKREMGSQ